MRKMLGFPKSPYASATIARRIADEEGTANLTVVNLRAVYTSQAERGCAFAFIELPPTLQAMAVTLGVSENAPNVVQAMLSKLGECSDVGDECTMYLVCVYACANGALLSLTLEAAAKASHAPGNVKGTNRPRMPTTERGTCVCMLVQMVCFCPLPCKLQPKLQDNALPRLCAQPTYP